MDARKAKSLRNNNDAESNHLASRIEEGTSLASCLTGVRSIENGLTAFSDILSESRIHQNITSKIYENIRVSEKNSKLVLPSHWHSGEHSLGEVSELFLQISYHFTERLKLLQEILQIYALQKSTMPMVEQFGISNEEEGDVVHRNTDILGRSRTRKL